MFCHNCGKQISDNQRFCSFCGVKLSNNQPLITRDSNTYSPISSQSSTIFNHDVLVNYLDNVRTLELAKSELSKRKADITNKISWLGRKDDFYSREPEPDNETLYYVLLFFGVIFFIAFLIFINISKNSFFYGLLHPVSIIAMIISGGIIIAYSIFHASDFSKIKKQYALESAKDAERVKNELNEKNRLSAILPIVEQELKQTEELLKSAYDINIIPSKYRNIYAAYFLYDYISTSTASLNDALYHCDLDEISRKLDVVIEQQREIILELAHSNALNQQIVQQNERMLKHAAATERNSELATQYSQIASINTQTVAQIQSYRFFKEGL